MNKHPLLQDDDTADKDLLIEIRRDLHDVLLSCTHIHDEHLRAVLLGAIAAIIDRIDQHA